MKTDSMKNNDYFILSPRYNKSIEEVLYFTNNLFPNAEIVITIGWRWGAVFVDNEYKQRCFELKENENYVDLYDEFDAELDYLDDGWYTDIEFIGDLSEEQKLAITDLWHENSYAGLENEQWFQTNAELWITGPFEINDTDHA